MKLPFLCFARSVLPGLAALLAAAPAAAETCPPLPERHWLAGDVHVHDDHSSDGSGPRQAFDQRGHGNVSVADQIQQGVIQGLDWMPLTDHRTYTQHYDPLWESAELLLLPGEEANSSPHGNIFGAVDTVLQGAGSGRPGWSRVQASIWDAHSQGAVYQHNHPDSGHLEDIFQLVPNENANAVGADLMEGWNAHSGIEQSMGYAEQQWNRGHRFAPSGGSDSHMRELWAFLGPGVVTSRVYAARTGRGVLQGMRRGNLTLGARNRVAPLLVVEAHRDDDGAPEAISGDELVVPAGEAVKLAIRYDRVVPGARLHVFSNAHGRNSAEHPVHSLLQPAGVVEFEVLASDSHQWFYAEIRGPGEPHSLDFDTRSDPERINTVRPTYDERLTLAAPVFIGPDLAVPQSQQPVPADQGGADGALALHERAEAFSGFPDVAAVGSTAHVVFEAHRDAATQVLYRRVGGAAQSPIVLSGCSATARFPSVAARGNDVWTVWQDERDQQMPRRPAILARHSVDGGSTWGDVMVLRTLEGRAERPDITLLADGTPLVVWQEIAAGGAFDVMLLEVGGSAGPLNLSGAGKTVTPGNGLDTRSARHPASIWPRIAADGARVTVVFADNREDPDPGWSGRFLVGEGGTEGTSEYDFTGTGALATAIDTVGVGGPPATEYDNWQIMVATRGADGQWAELVSLGETDHAEQHPDVAYDGAGNLVVVWDARGPDGKGRPRSAGVNPVIRAASRTAGESDFSFHAPAPGEAMSQYPRLGRDANGGVRAVWYDNRSADWRWRVATAVLAQSWSDVEIINGRGNNTWPATDAGKIVFASTRNAVRVQRDPTQEIFLVER